MSRSLPLKGIHHTELIVGNAKQAAHYYRSAFGFTETAYLGPETGHRGRASYVLEQGRIRLVLTSPLGHEDSMNVFLTLHGDAVRDIAFEVDDTDDVTSEALKRGAVLAEEPITIEDEHGQARLAAIRTYGDTIHSFVCTRDYDGPFLPGFHEAHKPGYDAGLKFVDHIVGNTEDRQMDRWADWYTQVLGFHQFVSYDDKDISTEFTSLRSKVMASHDRKIKFPINEPAPGRKKSQIQEYIDFHYAAGVQHLALYTNDILETLDKLRAAGVEFLEIPDTYYETVWDRVGEIKEDRQAIKDRQILVDRDESGYLLQLFTKPVQDRPTLFFEIIQRRGCQSFGKGNFQALFESIEREQDRRGSL